MLNPTTKETGEPPKDEAEILSANLADGSYWDKQIQTLTEQKDKD